MISKYIPLILTVVFNSLAHILLKASALQSGGLSQFNLLGIKSTYVQPFFIAGIACFGVSVIFYNQALSKLSLSYAFPLLNSAAFVIVLILAVILFKETMSSRQIIGALTILIGIWLIA
jgi:multidrug transporter EmrE-like cation transporter